MPVSKRSWGQSPILQLAGRYAWIPIPLLLAFIAVLWATDLRGAHESRTAMVLLNLFFTELASLTIAVLTARGFRSNGQPGLLMFGCGSLIWGSTSLAAAFLVDSVNTTVTVHNLGVLAAALCHFAGLLRTKRISRPSRWLLPSYVAAGAVAALIVRAATAGWTPLFFVQNRGGSAIRESVLLVAIGLFAWVSWQMLRAAGWRPGAFSYWYGLGLALVTTGLLGVALLSVQAGVLGWTNRLTQYCGSGYLLVAAWIAAREADDRTFSLASVTEVLRGHSPEGWARRVGLRLLMSPGSAIAAVTAALGIRSALQAWSGDPLPPYLTFYPTVMLVAFLSDFGTGVLATGLAAVITARWFLPEPGSPVARVGLLVFCGMGLFMSSVASLYRRYREKAAAYDREDALRESLGRLATFAEATFEGIVESEAGRILDCNEQLGRMLACPAEGLKGRLLLDLVVPEDRDRVAVSMRSGETSMCEYAMIRGDGARIVVEARSRCISPKGDARHTALREITQRKQAEEALREADRHKNEFLAVLSHELRNPLAPIRNSIHLLEHPGISETAAARAKAVIRRQTDHLARLVDDLLDVTRIARGKIELRPERLDLAQVVRRTSDDLREILAGREVTLLVELPGEPVWADADATRIAQVTGNLLHNAGKFTPAGGTIWLSLRALPAQAELRVRDTGAGIEPVLLDRLFTPFVQGERSLARSQGGLGLGLALTRGIVELHGGTVRAQSEGPGHGAEFILTLPLAPAPSPAAGAASDRGAGPLGQSVS